ncbi:hypothetical protein CHCC20333_4449 [Bacillus paralicheniformis]|nr:hypothetical protein CHCC20333_4449 [Bacillus paralicheniformis]
MNNNLCPVQPLFSLMRKSTLFLLNTNNRAFFVYVYLSEY